MTSTSRTIDHGKPIAWETRVHEHVPMGTISAEPAGPWDLERAWTLRRRAGFAATWDELQRDLTAARTRRRPRAGGQCRAEGVPADFRLDRRPPGRLGRGVVRRPPAQGVVGLPHALRARPAGRAADPDVAQPLRHQQPQGRRPRRHAAAERDCSAARPRPVRRLAAARAPRPGLAHLARRPATARGIPTRTSPAS